MFKLKADVWAAGCVLAEMFSGRRLVHSAMSILLMSCVSGVMLFNPMENSATKDNFVSAGIERKRCFSQISKACSQSEYEGKFCSFAQDSIGDDSLYDANDNQENEYRLSPSPLDRRHDINTIQEIIAILGWN